MKKYYSLLDQNKILHIIFRLDDFERMKIDSRQDIIDVNQFLQLSVMKLEKNKTFKPHYHIWKKGEDKVIAQESWVVIKGAVKCSFFDIDGKLIAEPTLSEGDCSVTLAGGHTYKILKKNTFVYEFKTGPYKGQDNDKEFLNEI